MPLGIAAVVIRLALLGNPSTSSQPPPSDFSTPPPGAADFLPPGLVAPSVAASAIATQLRALRSSPTHPCSADAAACAAYVGNVAGALPTIMANVAGIGVYEVGINGTALSNDTQSAQSDITREDLQAETTDIARMAHDITALWNALPR